MFSLNNPKAVSIINGEKTYGNYLVIQNMDGVSAPDAKVGDTVYVWWKHEKEIEFITASGAHFFVPNWQVDYYLKAM